MSSENYIYVLKYYLLTFVSMVKTFSRWSTCLPSVCTSQKENKCLVKQKTQSYVSRVCVCVYSLLAQMMKAIHYLQY